MGDIFATDKEVAPLTRSQAGLLVGGDTKTGKLLRSSMADVETYDFIKSAYAKGLSRGRIVGVHMLRNAALPVVTLAGVQAGQLIGGSIVVETIFA